MKQLRSHAYDSRMNSIVDRSTLIKIDHTSFVWEEIFEAIEIHNDRPSLPSLSSIIMQIKDKLSRFLRSPLEKLWHVLSRVDEEIRYEKKGGGIYEHYI